MQVPTHIKQAFEQYIAGKATTAEKLTVQEWFMSYDDSVLEWEGDEADYQAFMKALKLRLNETVSVREAGPIPSIHRIHFLKTTWFRYAAAVILVFGAAVYLWTTHKKTEQTLVSGSKRLQTDIASGRDRATLTLANGQQILLDSTQGNIVQQGNLTVVNLAGQLKYEGVGTTAEYNTITTPKGGQYQIVLPDGSKVWLNAASSIKFPTAFAGNTRKVEVTGEVYLEVAKNLNQPFTVTAHKTIISVLGTSFNVNAYSDENAIKTTLIDGSVKVTLTPSGSVKGSITKAIMLKPGEQAEIDDSEAIKLNKKVDLDQVVAWKNGSFLFNWTNLEDAMRQVARWYDVEVVYENKNPNIKLEGEMKRDLTLSQVLNGLSRLGVKFRIEGKRIIVL